MEGLAGNIVVEARPDHTGGGEETSPERIQVCHNQIRGVFPVHQEGGKRSSNQGKREPQPAFVLISKHFLVHQMGQHIYVAIRLEQIAKHVNPLNGRVSFRDHSVRSILVVRAKKCWVSLPLVSEDKYKNSRS